MGRVAENQSPRSGPAACGSVAKASGWHSHIKSPTSRLLSTVLKDWFTRELRAGPAPALFVSAATNSVHRCGDFGELRDVDRVTFQRSLHCYPHALFSLAVLENTLSKFAACIIEFVELGLGVHGIAAAFAGCHQGAAGGVICHAVAKILVIDVMAGTSVINQVAGQLHFFFLCVKHGSGGHRNQDANGEEFSVHFGTPLDN